MAHLVLEVLLIPLHGGTTAFCVGCGIGTFRRLVLLLVLTGSGVDSAALRTRAIMTIFFPTSRGRHWAAVIVLAAPSFPAHRIRSFEALLHLKLRAGDPAADMDNLDQEAKMNCSSLLEAGGFADGAGA